MSHKKRVPHVRAVALEVAKVIVSAVARAIVPVIVERTVAIAVGKSVVGHAREVAV